MRNRWQRSAALQLMPASSPAFSLRLIALLQAMQLPMRLKLSGLPTLRTRADEPGAELPWNYLTGGGVQGALLLPRRVNPTGRATLAP